MIELTSQRRHPMREGEKEAEGVPIGDRGWRGEGRLGGPVGVTWLDQGVLEKAEGRSIDP